MFSKFKLLSAIIIATPFLGASPAAAEMVLPQAYVQQAKASNIPPEVLYTLALIESGNQTASKVYRPWPWTLTINKESYYFNNQNEVTVKLAEVLAQANPPSQLGVGLMQIEWHYHKARFKSPSQALDPYYNLRVGAEYFAQLINETGDVWQAIGRYHSKTPKFAAAYQTRFSKHFVKLITKGGV